MIEERSKIKGIIDELMLNALRAKATHVRIDLEEMDSAIRIAVEDNGIGMCAKKLEQVVMRLSSGRRDELDAYYGELAGESHPSTGLRLVGMMVDKAEVHSEVGKGTRVVVYRNKR